MMTQAEFWIVECGGVWRKARKAHRCDAVNLDGPRQSCGNTIQPGDRYLDTGSHNGTGGGFGSDRFCESCADKPA